MITSWFDRLADRPRAAVCSAIALVVVLTVAYQAILGWDTEFDVDPYTGARSGPYELSQVLGLALVVVVAVVCAAWFGEPITTWLLSVGVLSWLWARNAAATDDSGLWGVGLMLLVPGLLAGIGVLVALTRAGHQFVHDDDLGPG